MKFIRTTGDLYAYHEVVSDVVASLHLQGGHISSWGGSDLRMLDHFQMGPNLVRGFAPAGIGPRDLTQYPWTGVYGDALGGTSYWGASLEFQMPLHFLPKDTGVKVAAFADAGSLWTMLVRPHSRQRARVLSETRAPPGDRASPTPCNARSITQCIFAPRSEWD